MSANLEDPTLATDWKRSFLSPITKKDSTKNVLTIGQLHSSPMLVRSCLKSCILGFSVMQIKKFQMFKLGVENEEQPEIHKLSKSLDHSKS